MQALTNLNGKEIMNSDGRGTGKLYRLNWASFGVTHHQPPDSKCLCEAMCECDHWRQMCGDGMVHCSSWLTRVQVGLSSNGLQITKQKSSWRPNSGAPQVRIQTGNKRPFCPAVVE